ncbi:MAG: hypothetical protein LBU45_07745, partial [Azoarcus sp.]|nr:hypothetical protein [Azoarcus sp.]
LLSCLFGSCFFDFLKNFSASRRKTNPRTATRNTTSTAFSIYGNPVFVLQSAFALSSNAGLGIYSTNDSTQFFQSEIFVQQQGFRGKIRSPVQPKTPAP